MPSAGQVWKVFREYGQVPHHASHFHRQENREDRKMKDTSHRSGLTLSRSADLQSCLESRFRQQSDRTGSTIYSMHWKKKRTPAGRQYFQLVASVPRISETGSFLGLSGWPTPTASDHKGSGQTVIRQDGKNRLFDRLDYAVEQGVLRPIVFSTGTTPPPNWLGCQDGRFRPVEPGSFPLADGVPSRVGLLRGYGNAIVPQVAAQFIVNFMDATGMLLNGSVS